MSSIPPTPSLTETITGVRDGIIFGFRLSLRRASPNDHPNNAAAIWHALWFRFLITVLNGVFVLGFDMMAAIFIFVLVSAIDTLIYPNASYAVMNRTGLGASFPRFITAYTWLGNFKIVLLMAISILASSFGGTVVQMVLFPFALWMIWASWSVATASLGRGGLAGAGMVFLALMLELLIAGLIITFIQPTLS